VKSARSHSTFVELALLLALGGCVSLTERGGSPVTMTRPAPFPAADLSRANAIAGRVEGKAKATQRAEGKQDLVRDRVAVKRGANGDPVVEQLGEASYYGHGFHGRKTASGTRFDQNALTAAHPTLPLGSRALVTNITNGQSVWVTITDRGPYVHGRDIDLSKGAAQRIGVTRRNGTAPVQIDAVIPPDPAGAVPPSAAPAPGERLSAR
jgi:rare lipoprotein A